MTHPETPDPHQTVASTVLDHSECAAIFRRHRIDFCCHGDRSIAAAAAARGVELSALLDELAASIAERGASKTLDVRELSTSELVSHIVTTHHAYLRRTLPFVHAMATKVSHVHGDHNPKLRELKAAVDELADALLPHLDAEERTLFPLAHAQSIDPKTVTAELESMTADHHVVAHLLERARAAADDYSLPDWACNSYRTLFAELEELEADTFEHIHLENHVLRPRLLEAPREGIAVR